MALFEDQIAVRGIVNSFALATGAGLIAMLLGSRSPISICAPRCVAAAFWTISRFCRSVSPAP